MSQQLIHNLVYMKIFLIILNLNVIVASSMDTHNVAKRMDLESCIGRFDVHRDTIIRTEESRSMGAKFLDNADLGSREECLRLCCETDGCDVFVFEEKSQGTCFLFQCGPPDNFRCKFTRHSNYTSAVLTPPRHIPAISMSMTPTNIQQQQQQQQQQQLQQDNKQQLPTLAPVSALSQHELELANLRGKPYHVESPTTIIPSLGIRISPQLTTARAVISAQITPTHCSRFQFQCHSGECIAVYNACDGIPQCEDGSDEGPECPSTILQTTKSPIGLINVPQRLLPAAVQQTQAQTQLQQQQQTLLMSSQRDQQPIDIGQQNAISSTGEYIVPSGVAVETSQKTSIIQRPYSHIPQNREDPMTAPQQQNIMIQQQQPVWPSVHQTNNDGQNYMDTDSHIFNHKGGLQIPTSDLGGMQYGNSMRDNNLYGNSAGDSYMSALQDNYQNSLQQQQQQIPKNQQQHQSQQKLRQQQQVQQQQWMPNHRVQQTRIDWPQQEILTSGDNSVSGLGTDQHQVQQQQQQQQQQTNSNFVAEIQKQQQTGDWPMHQLLPANLDEQHDNVNDKSKSSKEDLIQINQQTKPNESDEDSDYDEDEEKTTEPPKKKQRKHKKVKNEKEIKNKIKSTKINTDSSHADKPLHEQLKLMKTNLDIEFADHDGQAERPGGAVLSLTLGIIVTAALAVLVGCRMRAVGRRVRRTGKSPYAHDADFLVNGMYL